MHKEVEKYLSLKRKLIVLEYALVFGSNLEAYKACGIPSNLFLLITIHELISSY
jgi:hypothetical protein